MTYFSAIVASCVLDTLGTSHSWSNLASAISFFWALSWSSSRWSSNSLFFSPNSLSLTSLRNLSSRWFNSCSRWDGGKNNILLVICTTVVISPAQTKERILAQSNSPLWAPSPSVWVWPEGLPPVRWNADAAVGRSPPSVAAPLVSILLSVQSTCSNHAIITICLMCTREFPHAGTLAFAPKPLKLLTNSIFWRLFPVISLEITLN